VNERLAEAARNAQTLGNSHGPDTLGFLIRALLRRPIPGRSRRRARNLRCGSLEACISADLSANRNPGMPQGDLQRICHVIHCGVIRGAERCQTQVQTFFSL
jgi:hypothetical protein